MADFTGTPGNDQLAGSPAADNMSGGAGDDAYAVNQPDDRVIENLNEGNDRILASVSYRLNEGTEVELLSAANQAGTSALNLAGNAFAQTIFGNDGVNSLEGLAGNDQLWGLDGNDILDGGAGDDVAVGGAGNDVFAVDSLNDAVLEAIGEGSDRVLASVSYRLGGSAEVELLSAANQAGTAALDLSGNGFAQTILGNDGVNSLEGLAGNDQLWGLSGDDVLDGGTGNDVTIGGAGNDVHAVDSASDAVIEAAGQGNDRVLASVSYRLGAAAEVELLSAANQSGIAALDLAGSDFGQTVIGNEGVNSLEGRGGNDTLWGLGGNDILDGGTGDDIVRGGAGDDPYAVDSAGDELLEAAGEGSDRVLASTSYTLGVGVEVELLSAADQGASQALDLTGNAFGQIIFGNEGINRLAGGGGADTLFGLGGNDILDSGSGGGTLVGGTGGDQFVFAASAIGAATAINDMTAGVDRIVLGGSAGQAFAALATGVLSPNSFRIGSAAVDADDMIIYNAATGALLYDADGSGAGAAVQFATLQAGLSLTSNAILVSGAPNNTPEISSATTASIAENSSTSTIVYQTLATDADGDRILYRIGGQDASRFTIDANGAVRLISPADYETQNVYFIDVLATDSYGESFDVQVLTINVTDVAEGPGGGATPTIQETASGNDSTGTAQAISRGSLQPSTNSNLFDDDLPTATIRGSIATGAPNADIDFFSITLNAGERLILDIDNTVGSLDALVRIYDASGNELGFVDDSPRDPGSEEDRAGTTLDSFLSFRAPSTGTYYFSVESWGTGSDNGPGSGTTTGSYDLHVSVGPPVSDAQAVSEDVNALIGSNGWPDPNPSLPGTNLTFAFPNSPSDYPSGTSETQSNFEQFNGVQQNATTQMLQLIAGVANITFARLFDGQESSANLRFAMSDEPDVAYAYLPGGGLGGTAWFRNSPIDGRSTPSFDNPVPGGYAWMSILHESGHALGLKHGHEFPAVSFERDSVEFTMMTYRSYVGHAPDGYVNETWGFPSTPMMLDIAALQRMYGANFNFNSGDTVYGWSPTSGQSFVNGSGGLVPGGNRVFMTVWDGGGTDTYDLSNYAGNVRIDLRPGEFSLTSQIQLANLGQGHMARGNVGNAYLFNGHTRSLIENAVGGSGNDTLIANQAANRLTGGDGNDTFRWHSAENAGLGAQADTVTDFVRGADRIDLASIDAVLGSSGDDSFAFIGTNAFTSVAGQLRYEVEGNSVRIQGDVDGNGVADLEIVLNNVTTLAGSDFFF
jgi:serralysin